MIQHGTETFAAGKCYTWRCTCGHYGRAFDTFRQAADDADGHVIMASSSEPIR